MDELKKSVLFSKYDPKSCSRCGKSFICTGHTNCPCLEIVIPEKLLDFIADNYDNCLCPECIGHLKMELPTKKNCLP